MSIMKKEVSFLLQTRDLDPNDVIKPCAILDYFQDVAGMNAQEIGAGYYDLKKRDYAWVVLYQKFEIKNIPPYAENIIVKTWPKPKRRLEFEREYLIESTDGKILITGISNWVVINLKTRGLVKSNDINFNGEYYDFTNYLENCKRKIDLDVEKIEDEFSYQIEYDDLDHNGHTNNAKYLTIIYNHIGLYKTNKYISSVEIAYINEASYHDVIKIGHYKIDDKDAYIGFVGTLKCFECLIEVKEK